ncbi:hypothetical protein KKG41_04870 [Patescibacteria group bacterium]|nr:hypothetical protein [Patescibacteria group bacterium]MBU1890838.1 hypothetical protein [Patescibacteria group bacterium]
MSIIYGVDTDKKYDAIDVRRALMRCFLEAHREDQAKELEDVTQGMDEMSADKLTRANIEILLKRAFKKVDGDFEKPTKEVIVKVMNVLQEFSKQFRDPEIIKKHYNEMMQLVNGLDG